MSGATAVRSLRPLSAVVVPEWLAEVVRPRRAPVPWPEMARAALAICVPLSVSFAAGRGSLGVLPATGGLLGTLADAGGPYLSRVKRVCSAAVFGGAAGLTIGAVTPSGKILARTMARYVDPRADGPVIELGPGTGPVTEALVEQGIDPKPYTDMLKKLLSAGTNQHPGWPARLQRWWLYRRLADVAALEHFTAVRAA